MPVILYDESVKGRQSESMYPDVMLVQRGSRAIVPLLTFNHAYLQVHEFVTVISS